jgi:hypothetical protein
MVEFISESFIPPSQAGISSSHPRPNYYRECIEAILRANQGITPSRLKGVAVQSSSKLPPSIQQKIKNPSGKQISRQRTILERGASGFSKAEKEIVQSLSKKLRQTPSDSHGQIYVNMMHRLASELMRSSRRMEETHKVPQSIVEAFIRTSLIIMISQVLQTIVEQEMAELSPPDDGEQAAILAHNLKDFRQAIHVGSVAFPPEASEAIKIIEETIGRAIQAIEERFPDLKEEPLSSRVHRIGKIALQVANMTGLFTLAGLSVWRAMKGSPQLSATEITSSILGSMGNAIHNPFLGGIGSTLARADFEPPADWKGIQTMVFQVTKHVAMYEGMALLKESVPLHSLRDGFLSMISIDNVCRFFTQEHRICLNPIAPIFKIFSICIQGMH